MNTLQPGLTGSVEIIVGEEHTAPHVGSGRVHVLATPVMVNLMEAAALQAVEGLLPQDIRPSGRIWISRIPPLRRSACA